mgnify:CR=1 FL=1
MNEREKLLSDIARALRRAENIGLCGHVMPDGDCLGSELALGLALRKMGKKVTLLSPDPVPQMYNFLPGAGDIQVQLNGQLWFDVFVSVDCSVPDRLGSFKDLLHHADRVVILDHHAGSANFGDFFLNDPHAGATGEIIYDLLRLLPAAMDPEVATCLYVAIITDTGSFRYENTGPGTHRCVADLLDAGIPAVRVNKLLYEEKPLACLQVLGEVLQHLKISACGRVAWSSVPREMLHRFRAADEHADGVIDYLRMIKGVELAVVFREIEPAKYKVSFRSKYYLDVNKLAAYFGGGGHIRASACILEGNLAEIEEHVIQTALSSLEEAEK